MSETKLRVREQASSPVRRPRQRGLATSERLVRAAAKEFNERGFGGTDTNRIARRAGFAPQTFYRWFKDKVEIFIKTYERWQREELSTLSALLTEKAGNIRLAKAIVEHHELYLIFRRSLRQLAVENDAIRAARAQARLNQIAYIRSVNPNLAHNDADLAAMLFQTERLADALAEGEFDDLHLNRRGGEEALAHLIDDLLTPE